MKGIYCLLFLFSSFMLSAQPENGQQEKKKKGTFYIGWGYNKDWFSTSDLHFSGTNNGAYDFTLHDVHAEDFPGIGEVFSSDISVPQFIYRFGYYFNDKHDLGIEVGFDHAKYIVDRNQTVRISGIVHGETIDKDTVIDPHYIKFEHTNGANFFMVSLLKRQKFFASSNGKHVLNYVVKPGAGVVIPRTDVTLFGKRQDNVFHIAGYIAGVDLALRYEYGKHWYAETGFKGCFANYTDVLTIGDAKSNHHFYSLEYLFSIGYAFQL